MTTLFFKTETTAKALMKRKPSDPTQPRVVQLSMLLVDKNRRERGFMHEYIRPDKWVIDKGATDVHGITTRECDKYGKRIQAVLGCLIDGVRSAEEIVSYGFDFHAFMIEVELEKMGDLGSAARMAWKRSGLKRTCAMTAAAAHFGVDKTMKMEVAHAELVERPFDQRKDPVETIRAISRIHWAVQDRGF